MGTKLSPEDLKLYNTIDLILWRDWDPVGVYEAGESARDEYYSYLPKVYAMVKEQTSAKEISRYLYSIETERMSLHGNKKHCDEIASMVTKLRDKNNATLNRSSMENDIQEQKIKLINYQKLFIVLTLITFITFVSSAFLRSLASLMNILFFLEQISILAVIYLIVITNSKLRKK